MPNDAELLADLLDGRLSPADVPAELAELAELAGSVSQHITLVPPTPAFRAALREDVLQAVTGPGAGPPTGGSSATGAAGSAGGGSSAAGLGGASGAMSAATGIPAIIAAVAATAVLAASTQAVTARSVPGDALYGLKQGIESLQLTVAGEHRDVELLVGFATARVREAVELTDPAVVTELLHESERLLDHALTLALEQGRDVEDLVSGYASALFTLDSRTEDPTVQTLVERLLGDIGVTPPDRLPDAVAPGDDASEGRDDGTRDADDGPTDEPADQPADEPTEGTTDGPLDELDDPLDDPLDELDDPLDDPLDELDDPLDELDDTVGDIEDEADDTLDDVTGTPGG